MFSNLSMSSYWNAGTTFSFTIIYQYFWSAQVIIIIFINRYEEAEKCCCLLLDLDVYNTKAYLIRARAKNKLGRLEDAIEGQYITKNKVKSIITNSTLLI